MAGEDNPMIKSFPGFRSSEVSLWEAAKMAIDHYRHEINASSESGPYGVALDIINREWLSRSTAMAGSALDISRAATARLDSRARPDSQLISVLNSFATSKAKKVDGYLTISYFEGLMLSSSYPGKKKLREFILFVIQQR